MATRSKFIEEYMNGNDMQKELIKTGLERELWNIAHKDEKIENNFNLKDEYEKVFERVCHSSGKSDTVFGEIIRGLTKLLYREYNDGDDICCGYYSGIWYGLKNKLYCPFTYSDNSVEYWDIDFDALNNFGYSYRTYAENIMLNALILETFDDFDKSNCIDISDYYDNIVKFLVDEKTIKKFTDRGIDITNNFGCYQGIDKSCYENTEINSIDEDIYITFKSRDIAINYTSDVFNGGDSIIFNLEFSKENIDMVLDANKELLKYLISISDYKKRTTRDKFLKVIEELGYTVNGRDIVKKEQNENIEEEK